MTQNCSRKPNCGASVEFLDLFRLCAPPPYVMLPQCTCHCIVNHYVKIWHIRLGGENNMHPLRWGYKRKRCIPSCYVTQLGMIKPISFLLIVIIGVFRQSVSECRFLTCIVGIAHQRR